MRRVTLGLLWTGVMVAAVAGGAVRVVQSVQPSSYWGRLSAEGDQPLNSVAYAIALFFCLRITADYGKGTPMRLAWMFMAASCSTSLLRHVFELGMVQMGLANTMRTTLVSLRQIPTELSLVFMAASLLVMWRSFAALGLGVRFKWFDWVLMAAFLFLIPLISSSPVEMRDSHSAYTFIRFLQSASPYCLAVVAVLAVFLYRTTTDLGAGQLSLSLWFVLLSVALRLFVMLLGVWPSLSEHPMINIASRGTFAASHWVFLLGMGYRWLLTVSNSEMVSRYQQSAEAELAELSRMVMTTSRIRN
ncbi:MAG TPA: hypothetical protein VG675_04570 [Bryobacteraceae bacterium]|nr:hypothetical protein [Bryobacteraceae bacterium]